MNDDFAPRPVAGWYLPAAIASLLFMGLGCIMYLMHVLTDPRRSFSSSAGIRALPHVLGAPDRGLGRPRGNRASGDEAQLASRC